MGLGTTRFSVKALKGGPGDNNTVRWYVWCLVAKLCLTLCDPMDFSSPGSFVHGISQARILERVAISSSRGIFLIPRDRTYISCIGRQILYH